MMMRRRSSVVLQILSSKTMISTATPKPFEKIIRFGGPSSSLSLSSLSFQEDNEKKNSIIVAFLLFIVVEK